MFGFGSNPEGIVFDPTIQRTYLSDVFDLGQTPTGVTIIPATPGFLGNVQNAKLLVVQLAGAFGLLGGSFHAGNDAARSNIIGGPAGGVASINATSLPNAFTDGVRTWLNLSLTNGFRVPWVDLSTPALLDVTVPNNGVGIVFRVRMAVSYSLIPWASTIIPP